jgi:LmbE family N-acetylglucosaminyl deacetylase
VTFLDHVDPPGKPHRTFAPDVSVKELATRLAELFDRLRPSVVITHGSGGEYWHPAHLLVHHAVLRAAGSTRDVLTIHAWQAGHSLPGLLNRDDPADLVVDGGPHRARRLAALRAHASQHAYFVRHGGGTLEAFIDRTAREAYRHYPPAIGA